MMCHNNDDSNNKLSTLKSTPINTSKHESGDAGGPKKKMFFNDIKVDHDSKGHRPYGGKRWQ